MKDKSIISKQLFLKIKLYKYKCNNKDCITNYFVESIDNFAEKGERRTNRLNSMIFDAVKLRPANECARLYHELDISSSTFLRSIKRYGKEPDIQTENVTAIGIDDFALKKNIDTVL